MGSAREVALSHPYYSEVPGHSLLLLTLEYVRKLMLGIQVISEATDKTLTGSSSPWFPPRFSPCPLLQLSVFIYFHLCSRLHLLKASGGGSLFRKGGCSVSSPSVKYPTYQVQSLSNHEMSLLGCIFFFKAVKVIRGLIKTILGRQSGQGQGLQNIHFFSTIRGSTARRSYQRLVFTTPSSSQ